MSFNETTPFSWSNTTTIPSNQSDTLPVYAGFIFIFGASFFYGSNYLPVKQFETGDGLFFQLVLCIGIWLVGFVINCVRGFPKFYALPLLGGFLWSTGNNTVVPIIKTIGIGIGMIFWNCTGLVTGWATARFGLFGLKEEIPSNKVLNYVGVALVLISTIFYLFVKTDTKSNNRSKSLIQPETSVSTDILNESDIAASQSINDLKENNEHDIYNRLGDRTKRIFGTVLAVSAGVLYGESNTPILYIKDNYENPSLNNMDYLFSYYTGILVTSLMYFVLYCIIKKNKPVIYNEVILPGLASGVMWGLANLCYFLANNALGQAIIYPIVGGGPAIVASLWGVFLYKEIKGLKNFIFLLIGFAFAITGAVLCGLSF